jgi:uncharacterized protein YcfL
MKVAMIACLLGLLAGCVPPSYQGRNDPYPAGQIQFTSSDLQGDTAVGRPIVSRDPAGYLRVNIPIRATINQDLHVDYQTQFFDATGAVIETTAWHTVTLPANTPYSVSDVSTTPAAANFQVTFRYER